jgi:hypothetical protein
MISRALALWIAVVSLLPAAACERNESPTPGPTRSSTAGLAGLSVAARAGDLAARKALAESARARMPPPVPLPNGGPLGVHTRAELEAAATRIIGFLRGDVAFDSIQLADTVTFYVSPEGGGTRAAVSRERLRDRSNWKVRGLLMYTFSAPRDLERLTVRTGRHFRCREHALAALFPELARLPHVGTRLDRGEESTCLQTLNATFVFDPDRKPPTLVAAVYEQFEW